MNDLAKEIFKQLGGNRFAAMTGAKTFVYSDTSLMFSIGRGALNGINKIVVKLTPLDTYKVTFYKVRGVKADVMAQEEDVYNDTLQAAFTRHTGFKTSL